MNHVKTAMLLAGLTALFLWAGHALGGLAGLVVALGLAALMNLMAWFHSDKLILALHGARQVGDREAPELVALVRGLSERAGLPMPRVFLLPDETPNAFAVGRNPRHAAVAVTRGLVERMDRRELAGVIAHELGHIRCAPADSPRSSRRIPRSRSASAGSRRWRCGSRRPALDSGRRAGAHPPSRAPGSCFSSAARLAASLASHSS